MKDYKKILEGVVNIINTTEKSDIGFANICTYIGEKCPELKESEDERIRKALIRFHKSTIDVDGIKGKDILAWLEAQGEHANFRNAIQIGDKVTRNEDGVLVNLSQLNRVAKKDEKQGEQKPAWSEEDEEMHRKCICAMRASACGFPEEEKFVEQVNNWLKSLKDRYTWKPSDEHYELEEFAKIVRGNLTGISEDVQEQFKAKYLQLTGNRMYGGFKD